MKRFRMVICVDVSAATAQEAYAALCAGMARAEIEDLEWESTDEWFSSDNPGEPMGSDEREAAIRAYYESALFLTRQQQEGSRG